MFGLFKAAYHSFPSDLRKIGKEPPHLYLRNVRAKSSWETLPQWISGFWLHTVVYVPGTSPGTCRVNPLRLNLST